MEQLTVVNPVAIAEPTTHGAVHQPRPAGDRPDGRRRRPGSGRRPVESGGRRARARPPGLGLRGAGPPFKAAHPELSFLLDHPETPVSLYPSPECFQVFVVGAVAGRSLYFHGGTVSVTKPVR